MVAFAAGRHATRLGATGEWVQRLLDDVQLEGLSANYGSGLADHACDLGAGKPLSKLTIPAC
jgi:hypothetical protein